MYVPGEKEILLENTIRNLFTRKFDDSLLADTAEASSALIDGHYFTFCQFGDSRGEKPLFISNNPPDFVPVYLSVMEYDFLTNAVVERGKEYVLRRNPEFHAPENRRFIRPLQDSRPISDIIFEPISIRGGIRGYCALGRAGLHSAWYSDSEVELFRFVASFIKDAFVRSMIPEPDSDDIAYLDFEGNFLSSGERIADICEELFEWEKSLRSENAKYNAEVFGIRFARFMLGEKTVGIERLKLCSGRKEFHFVLERLQDPPLLERCRGPCATLRWLDRPFDAYAEPTLDFDRLSSVFGITLREFQVIRGIFQAKSNKTIAYELHVDESTVKRHTHNIYEKTGFKTRVELVQHLGT